MRVGRERGLDLHVGKQVAGTQCLLQRIKGGLRLLRIRLLADRGLRVLDLLCLGRVGCLDILHRQSHRGLDRRHALLDPGVQGGLIVDTGFLVRLNHVTRADLLYPVLEVVRRLVRAAGSLHLHLQHRAKRRHCIQACAAVLLHARQQLREPSGHVASLKATCLALVRDRLERLLHHLRVVDLSVLLQRHDHARCVDAAGPLADRKLRRDRRVGQGLVQLHAGADELVDQIGNIVARHTRIFRRVENRPGQLRLFGLVRYIRLDRDVTDNRLIVRADLCRDRGHAHADDSSTYGRLEHGLARVDLLPPLLLHLSRFHLAAEALVLPRQAPDLDALPFQGIQIALQLAQQPCSRCSPAVVGPLPLVTQLDGFADGVLQHLRLAARVLQLFDMALGSTEGGAERRRHGPTNFQRYR